MLALHELQSAFAAGLISGDADAIALLIAGGAIASEDRIRIHRNTMLGALTGALRLSFPAVDALVGGTFFDHMAAEFAQLHPPQAALLTLYGADFPDFLAGYSPAAGLTYLADVARLEWAVEQAAHAASQDEAPPIATATLPGVTMALTPSLRLLGVDYPAEEIWRAVLNNDEAALDRIDPGPAPGRLAIWQSDDGASVGRMSIVAATFLERLLIGFDAETALAAASAADPEADAIGAITAEILQSGFVRLTPTPAA